MSEKLSLKLCQETNQSPGDSRGLQKGLIMFVGDESLCGEGVGFGVPAIQYSNQILFSTTAMVAEDKELVKSFSIDALPRKIWKGKFPIDNRAYYAVQRRLADAYITDTRFRSKLSHIMHIQSLLGIKLSYQRIESKGFVEVSYRLCGNIVMITVDISRLVDKNLTRLFVFNEQSADFDLYEDEFGILNAERIGAWEEVKSRKASLTTQKSNLTFSLKNMAGVRLYRGWELLKPRLDWAGFCYSVPPQIQQFSYSIQIT